MKNKWNEIYPRPQLVREEWLGLNGEWRFKTSGGIDWETINVPFCPESSLSGIGRRIQPGETMIYERGFAVPDSWKGNRILLHFGAVDQTARVYVNKQECGSHEGGYLPFTCEITSLVEYGKINTLRVEAADDLDHKYPWGKQRRDNGGMWYTPVSGIWQPVWLEPVPADYITSLKIDVGADWAEIRAYGIEAGTITVLGEDHRLIREYPDAGDLSAGSGDDSAGIRINDSTHSGASYDSDVRIASIRITFRHPRPWTPDDPHLYDFTIISGQDRISSYFALRTLSVEESKEDRGTFKRLCLNGSPFFFNGLLDQGYWQDGIYTPEGPECYKRDILAMKSLGFNTLRKHIKIEPDIFYYYCDKYGMAVFQDMVNNSDYSFLRDTLLPSIGLSRRSDHNLHPDPESRRIFLESMEDTVKHLYNHPSICYWTIFNEGWGQFCADAAYDRLRALDPVRFIDTASGWFRQSKSDVESHHIYLQAITLRAGQSQDSRPLVISELGGYACKLPEHCFNKDKTYGYRKYPNEAALLRELKQLYERDIIPLAGKGLCAAIYTQVSDVEDETNGILTYDREVQKMKAYTGTGRIEIIGNHTDHQGGRVMVAPSDCKIRAMVADNHRDVIMIDSEGFTPFEVSLTDRKGIQKGTTPAIVAGILEGFANMFDSERKLDFTGRGFDAYIKSDVAVGSGLSSSAAFEILLCRIINDKYYDGQADPVQIARIAMFAEREYYGKPCGMMDQLAIALGQLAMIDFYGPEPEIELIDFDWDASGYELVIVPTKSDHEGLDDDYASVPDDMFKAAEALGISRLSELSSEQFRRRLPEMEELVRAGELTELQLNRARHFYDENERVLAAAVALKMGNIGRFLQCVNASGLSSENLLQNIVPPGMDENDLSRTIALYRTKADTAAVRLIGGGFGGSVLVFRKK